MIDATGQAAAERLARFDIELDLDDTNEWGWLDVTHTLTYLNALRWAWSADPYAAGAARPVPRRLVRAVDRPVRHPRGRAGVQPAQAASDQRRHARSGRRSCGRDPEAAIALVDGFTGPREELERSLIQAAAEDHSTTPIMVAHVIKTAQAAVAESRALGEGQDSIRPMAAAARFIASPKRERFVLQSTLEAITTLRGVPKAESDQVRP